MAAEAFGVDNKGKTYHRRGAAENKSKVYSYNVIPRGRVTIRSTLLITSPLLTFYFLGASKHVVQCNGSYTIHSQTAVTSTILDDELQFLPGIIIIVLHSVT